MKPDDPLLRILACPLDKGPLVLIAADDALYNPRLRRRYPIVDGVPQLLPSSGEQVSAEEHERLLARMETAGGVPGAAGLPEGEGRP
ncbi:Trm112 family protein [Streptomyces sp. NPDC047117]|uniref:Trm112 family protein n=1 Tax=unclassified Streptomyces TaxID=2593676 RepID=UPI0033D60719